MKQLSKVFSHLSQQSRYFSSWFVFVVEAVYFISAVDHSKLSFKMPREVLEQLCRVSSTSLLHFPLFQLFEPKRQNEFQKFSMTGHKLCLKRIVWRLVKFVTERSIKMVSQRPSTDLKRCTCYEKLMKWVPLEPFGVSRSDVVLNPFIFLLTCNRPKHSSRDLVPESNPFIKLLFLVFQIKDQI